MQRLGWFKHTLHFHRPSGTSRGVLHTKDSWIIYGHERGWAMPAMGECSLIRGLSPDPEDRLEAKLNEVVEFLRGRQPQPDLTEFPALSAALEMFQLDVHALSTKVFFDSGFASGNEGILTNGLIWMGDRDYLEKQISDKIDQGFRCLKMKVGHAQFEQELDLLRWVRTRFFPADLEIRLDANGAFPASEAMARLQQLDAFHIHSIEQPIAPGQRAEMAALCAQSPIPIALDEELIGVKDKVQLLREVKPQFIILKPSLLGGFEASDLWIKAAEEMGTGWWITSALESNIGLSAIAQYAATKNLDMPQGLGTGMLYSNNFVSPLVMRGEYLWTDTNGTWRIEIPE